jgi:hypothetical protein
MGNKPSLEQAFDTANQVYHEYQRIQKEQLGQQQPQYNNQYPGNHSQPFPQQPSYGDGQHQPQSHQQPPNQHYNNHAPQHPPSPSHFDEGDDPEYTRLRGLAHQEALTRNECYERSQQAYNNGDGAGGKISTLDSDST